METIPDKMLQSENEILNIAYRYFFTMAAHISLKAKILFDNFSRSLL